MKTKSSQKSKGKSKIYTFSYLERINTEQAVVATAANHNSADNCSSS